MDGMRLQDIVTEIQYNEFVSFVKEHNLDKDCLLTEGAVWDKIKKYAAIAKNFPRKVWDFIKDLHLKLSFKLHDLIGLFLHKVVFGFFAACKWSWKQIKALVDKGKEITKAIWEYVKEHKVRKWSAEKLKPLNDWLGAHPKIEKIGTGLVVAAVIAWFLYTGDILGSASLVTDMTAGIAGSSGLTLASLFAGGNGKAIAGIFLVGGGAVALATGSVVLMPAIVGAMFAAVGKKKDKEKETKAQKLQRQKDLIAMNSLKGRAELAYDDRKAHGPTPGGTPWKGPRK